MTNLDKADLQKIEDFINALKETKKKATNETFKNGLQYSIDFFSNKSNLTKEKVILYKEHQAENRGLLK